MKRSVFLTRLLLTVLLLSAIGWSQTTSVTLQVTDADSQSWNNGTYSVTLVQQSGAAGGALSGGLNGVVFRNSTTGVIVPNQLQTGSLNGTGGASLTLTPNASIGPLSAWAFTVCPQATASCYTQQVQIAGASQTVTLTPLGPRISMINPPPLVLAYSDTELLSPSIGQQYFNLITHAQRQWNGSVWSSATTGVTDVSGADPTGIADSYTAIQAAITAAIAAGKCVFLPAGTYKTSAGLTAPATSFCMYGLSPVSTSITASGTGYNVLTIGPGADGSYYPSGSVSGIHFIGNAKPGSPTGISALQLNAVPHYKVHDVGVDTADIGIDLINNNYGAEFENVRGGFGGTLNVGINLRNGAQSGSDLSFYNPWVDGDIAGVSMSPGGGGYHFWGGQITAGQGTGAPSDSAGAVIMGQDYLTGTTGEVNADFHGTSFEGTNYAWIFRTFQQVHLGLYSISADPADAAHPAIGFFKGTTMNNSHVLLNDTALSGYYSGASLLSFAGQYTISSWEEHGTYSAAQNPTINSVLTYVPCMATQSAVTGLCTSANSIVPPLALTDTASNVDLSLTNTTAATSGTSQSSPSFKLAGTYWNGSSSNPDFWTFLVNPFNGTNNLSELKIFHTGTSGAAYLNVSAGASLGWDGRAQVYSPADHIVEFQGFNGGNLTRMQFGGTTSSFAALCPSATVLGVCLADGTAGGSFTSPSVAENDTGGFGSALTESVAACETSFAPTTLATGATTTDTGLSCLPANSIIDAVVARVTTTITAACTGWELGDATTAARFSSNNTTLTTGTTTDAAHIGTFNNTGIASATTGIWQTLAAKVRVTCAGGNPGAGAIRVIVYYHTWTPPTS